MALHQLLPVFSSNDTLVQATIHLQLLARRLGSFGRIYAREVAERYEPLAAPLSALDSAADDVVLYHSCLASPASEAFLNAKGRRGVVFHPSVLAHYEAAEATRLVAAARAEQAILAAQADFTIVLSERDRAQAAAAGFNDIHLVPRFVEPERFAADPRNAGWVAGMRQQKPNLVAVCELLPHERIERLLAIHREVRRLRPDARLFLIVREYRDSSYARAIVDQVAASEGACFIRPGTHRELVAAMRTGDLFLSASLLPREDSLLETMAAEVPVLVAGSADFRHIAQQAIQATDEGPARQATLDRRAAVLARATSERAGAALGQVMQKFARKRARLARKAKPRIAVVVQRYGDVVGGSERLAADVVRQLAPYWEITVLTSCAKDYITWANEFAPGEDTDPAAPGVKVLRFPVSYERTLARFDEVSRGTFGQANDRLDEELWAVEQGPYAPGLLEHLDRHAADYDGFLFFTYVYAPSLLGLPMVADRALLVPTAHDEPSIQLDIFNDVFERPRGLLLLAPEELDIIARYHPRHAPARAVGTGIDLPARMDPMSFRRKFGIERPYLLYVGRIEVAKGLAELIEFHAEWRRRSHDAPDLVLAGELLMPLDSEGVRFVGRIDEQDKWDALAGAFAVTVPSRYESLSLLAVEGLAAGAPILVNGGSEVLQGHVDRSGTGASYTDQESFIAGLAAIARERTVMSSRGKAYAAGYTWPNVVKIYREEMDKIVRG